MISAKQQILIMIYEFIIDRLQFKCSYNHLLFMIEVVDCPNCLSIVPKRDLSLHQFTCASSNSEISSSSKSNNLNQYRAKLNIELMKEQIHIGKFKQILTDDIKVMAKRQLEGQASQLNVVLNMEDTCIDFWSHLPQTEAEQITSRLQEIAEKYINSYEVVVFSIDPTHSVLLDQLQDQYIFQETKSDIYFIAKKDQILWKVVKFFEKLMSLSKAQKKIKLSSQILQVEQGKQKQLQEIIKSINLFIANTDEVVIKYKNANKKCFIFISGFQETVNVCKQHIESSLSSDSLSMSSKRFKLSEQQFKIISKGKILDNYKQNYGVKFETKTYNILRTYRANKNSSIYLIFNPSILAFPKEAVIILPENIMKQVKQFQQSIQSFKQHVFFSPEQGGSVLKSFSQFVNFYVQSQGQIGLALPQKNVQNFIEEVINVLNSCEKSIKVYILERVDESAAIKAFQECTMKQKKWFVTIKGQKKYYPDNVCQSIQSAILNGIEKIVITNQDLNINKVTHTYNYEQGQIVHKGTGNVNYVQDQVDQLVVFVEDFHVFTKKKKKKAVQLTFAVFQLYLELKIQRNLISNSKYQISSEMVKKNNPSDLDPEKTELQLVIKYPDPQTIDIIWNEIRTFMHKNRFIKLFELEGINIQKLKQIENWAKLNKIQINLKGNQMQAYSYNQAAIASLQKLIQIHKKRLLAGPLEYPPYWQEDQKEEFSMHAIGHQTEEFQSVQTKFKVGKISKLERVQNKILFEKYNNQKAFLKELNGGKIRELMMYHGTRTNKPQMIYGDREESFNINYANVGSYGKGIYFAKNSEYSNNYCYAGREGKQMFYCLVLAGNSQIYTGKQQLDTSFRDPVKKIRYQSVANGKNQDIIVVFKNRRAYPLYLITYN